MFIKEEVVVRAPLGAVRSWLAEPAGLLSPFTVATAGWGGDGRRSVRREVAWSETSAPQDRQVVATLPSHQRGAAVVIPLRCYGPFSTDDRPTIDADLELTEDAVDVTRLAFVGVFRTARDDSDAAEAESARNDRATESVRDFLTLLASACERDN